MVVVARLQAALGDTYRIERELGGGGMSHVFVAEEVALGRKVVVKVLPPEMGAGVNAERFRREIQLAASLQHPHIVPLLNAGHTDDLVWYTMPLIEGESLRTRLAREGELPVAEAVRLLRDVADALAYAHQHGVVHRDIKPDNVLISGQHAVVTDFGVSKAITAATGEASLTSIGIALGTPAYMAPEQAAAEPHVDHRADLYALGAMAYEMLTGAPPFGGEATVVLAAHVTRAPEAVTARRAAVPAVPAALGALVMRCLEKKPADRWQSAAELHQQLEVMATPSGGMTPTGATPAARAPAGVRAGIPKGLLWAAVGVAIVVLGWAGWRLSRPAEPVWELSNIRQVTHEPELELFPAIAPDGRQVAYEAGYGLAMRVYVRDVTGGRALSLTADRAGEQGYPSWSPDARQVTFWQTGGGAPNGAFAVPRMGGPVTSVGQGFVWAQRGDSVLFQRGDSLFVGRADQTGESFLATARSLHSAAWSPDGKRVAYVRGNGFYVQENLWANAAPSSVWTVGLRDRTPALATDSTSQAFYESPAWLQDGSGILVVSNRDGPRDVYLVRLGAGGRPRGAPLRLTTGLELHTLSIAADGRTIAYSRLIRRGNLYSLPIPKSRILSIRDATAVTSGNQVVENQDVSRDGRWLTFDSNLEGKADIYVMPAGGGEPRRVTRGAGDNFSPNFSPDAREIVFYSTRHGTRDLFLINTDGTGETRLTSDPGEEMHPKFSPDGLKVAYYLNRGSHTWLYLIHRDSIGGRWSTPEQLTHGGSEDTPRWSLDGRRLAFFDASGVAVLPLGGKERTVLSLADFSSALCARWSPDGKAIWFGGTSRSGQAGIFEVPEAGGTPKVIVRFDDPARLLYPQISAGGGKVYPTIAEFESDVYVAELKRR